MQVLQDASVANGDSQEETPLIKEVQELEVRAIRAADQQELDEALQLLNLAVAKAPSYASAYNNRAQVRGEGELGQTSVVTSCC